ncbi:hypothetical protein CBR_g38755 [Chara braunii]|uniref:Integrase zinc-binding domain-containing protein n=1 Tax=Chara braunii TaxID=69332 RepID=A0A388LQC4_CHABU|nr:hypothetical protein CBR_g38755 [Chara braunii]|eukprot:GBG84471.1 hypothetical protein CBR_g38755 [Chara braunii]
MPYPGCPDHDQEQIQLASISVTTIHHSVIDEFRTYYRHCPDYRDIHAVLRSGKTVPKYSIGDNGFVYWHSSHGTREPRICVPSTGQLRVRAVAEFHDQVAVGHMGFHKTLAHVSRLYVWPKRKDFAKDYVAECPSCQEERLCAVDVKRKVGQCPCGSRRTGTTSVATWRGRSVSPRQNYGAQLPRSLSADSKTTSKLEELGGSVATLKEFVDQERIRRGEKERKRLAREEAKKKELEALQREAEERLAEEAHCLRKLEKQRRCEEEQLAMTTAVEMQLAVRLSKIQEEIKNEVRKVVEKGKAKEEQPSSSGSASEPSEVEVITVGTENLATTEKRKRGEDTLVGNSPPVTMPAKKQNQRASIRQLRFSERLQRTRTRVIWKNTRSPTGKASSAMKPPTRNVAMERLMYLDQARRESAIADCELLRDYCRLEGVTYTTKVQVIFDLADARERVRFGLGTHSRTDSQDLEAAEEEKSSHESSDNDSGQ